MISDTYPVKHTELLHMKGFAEDVHFPSVNAAHSKMLRIYAQVITEKEELILNLIINGEHLTIIPCTYTVHAGINPIKTIKVRKSEFSTLTFHL